MAQYVTVNLKKDVIVMKLSEKATQADTIKSLKKKLPELKKLYQQEKTPIFVTGRILKNKEIREIQEVIKKSINVEVEFDTPKALGLNEIRRTYNKDVEISESKIHRGSLRSGQRMEYEGTLIILGDVNAGAEVIAGDNVVVVGNLRGLAHAGAKGNKQAIVAANRIDTPQLRIANIIKEMVKDVDDSEVVGPYLIISPVLGPIAPTHLSGGVKVLILLLKDPNFIYNISNCGDNCAKWLLEIGRQKDVTINLRHMMGFGKETEFNIKIKNNGKIVQSMKELIPVASYYLNSMKQE